MIFFSFVFDEITIHVMTMIFGEERNNHRNNQSLLFELLDIVVEKEDLFRVGGEETVPLLLVNVAHLGEHPLAVDTGGWGTEELPCQLG